MKIIFIIFISVLTLFKPFCADAMGESAKSAVLIEKETGEIIYEKNAHTRLPMASTTKIMTAICAIESGMLNDTIEIDDRAVGIEGSSIYLQKGESMTLRDLCYGLMLNSGNDAACAIAYAVSGSIENFAELMNKKAESLGLKNTHFDNPSGLDSETHYTTAYELAKITAYALKNEEFAKIVSTKKTTIPNTNKKYERYLKNHNKLLNMYEGCDGVKTGFTKKCGRCLVSSATKNSMTLIAVTLNDPDDWNTHMAMLNYGFEHTELLNIFKKGSYVATVDIEDGEKNSVALTADEDLFYLSKDGKKPEIKMEYKLNSPIYAPIKYGEVLGKICVDLDGRQYEVDAVSRRIIPKRKKLKVYDMFKVLYKQFAGLGV